MRDKKIKVLIATPFVVLAVAATFLLKKYREEKEISDLLVGVEAEVTDWNPRDLTITLKFLTNNAVQTSRAKITFPGSSVRLAGCSGTQRLIDGTNANELEDAFRIGDRVEVAAKKYSLSESVPEEFEVSYVVNQTPKGCEN